MNGRKPKEEAPLGEGRGLSFPHPVDFGLNWISRISLFPIGKKENDLPTLYPVISDLKFPYPISFPSKYLASVLHLYPVKSDVVKLTFQIWYTNNRHWQRKSFQITSSFYLPQQDTKRPTTMKKKQAPFTRQYLVLFSRAFRRVCIPRTEIQATSEILHGIHN